MKNESTLMMAILFAACNFIDTKTELKDNSNQANSLTNEQLAEGWELLYDGQSKNGWHIYLNGSDGSAWKSVNGTLYLDASRDNGWQSEGGGDLVTDSVYENFHLYLEWKISEEGNSGVLFNVREDPAYEYSWFTGPELQLLDNLGHRDGKIITRRAGSMVGLVNASKESVNAPGRWNSTDIRLEKGQLDLFINGKQNLSIRIGDQDWRRMNSQSEFKNFKEFGSFNKGHIALQDHGDPVWFRNIRIRRL